MTVPGTVQPDPTAIGGIAKAPFVLLPDPSSVFVRRANRYAYLATASALAPYLRFLASLARLQAELAADLPSTEPVDMEQIARAQTNAMPLLDRDRFSAAPGLSDTLDRLFDAAGAIEKPAVADQALRQVRASGRQARQLMMQDVLCDAIPIETLAEHTYVAAAVHVYTTQCAAALPPDMVTPIADGVCPVCGAPPVASYVAGFHGAEGTRYCVCSCCNAHWNYVRVKCVACGATKGIGYREVADGGEADATIKAEVCDTCHSWVKIMYANKNASLDPVADSVASLGLDILMRESEYRHAGYNPYLIGY